MNSLEMYDGLLLPPYLVIN